MTLIEEKEFVGELPQRTPQTIDEAKAILRIDGKDKAFRMRASVARRILNEESQLETQRLYMIQRAIKSLKKARV